MEAPRDLATLPTAARAALEEILGRSDPDILAVILTGSAARGNATNHSDVDVMVIRDASYGARPVMRTSAVDEIPLTLVQLETVPPIGSAGAGTRWSFAWASVLEDRTGGRVQEAVRRQATLTDEEISHVLLGLGRLDEFINFAYRALKSHRDGRLREARLDSAESVASLLDIAFALAGRVRPYNKYLAWELREHPLGSTAWQHDPGMHRVLALLDGSAAGMRDAFAVVERECRARDTQTGSHELGDLIDSWEPDLDLLRGITPSAGPAEKRTKGAAAEP